MAPPLRGSCLCGGLRYEIAGPLSGALHCHCSLCRKAHGAVFRSRAALRRADFRWIQGEDLLAGYRSSPGTTRHFCRVCGSSLLSSFDDRPEVLGLALGTLDDDPGLRPALHVFVGSKAPWYEITDDLPQYETLPGEG
ncbi:GFA family protein [Roseicella sp. DB1501]|uniref:GFA family protein n=1 Tax=Roseicella sp. DB1501 TaxID=2730925 RepID=UPI0014914A9A|nr:GFA family protein [Roseicella sp. DB1501]NOG70051.1 GFA family protein [Roseicella sp. DB1501]